MAAALLRYGAPAQIFIWVDDSKEKELRSMA